MSTTELQGLDFPFRFGHTGGLARVTGADKIKANLKALVLTSLRSRVMKPGLGTVAYSRVLRNLGSPQEALIRQLVSEAIIRGEPRVQVLRVDVRRLEKYEGTATVVEVGYNLLAARVQDTLSVVL